MSKDKLFRKSNRGWFADSNRHSRAKLNGKAGPIYKEGNNSNIKDVKLVAKNPALVERSKKAWEKMRARGFVSKSGPRVVFQCPYCSKEIKKKDLVKVVKEVDQAALQEKIKKQKEKLEKAQAKMEALLQKQKQAPKIVETLKEKIQETINPK